MEVTLLGTGDTTGTPTPGCACDTCERARDLGVERSRFSVHVRSETAGESLLIDASPDLRQQLLATDVALPDAALVTHLHFDHLDGLGNAYRLVSHLPVLAPALLDPVAGSSVAGHVSDRYDYLDAVDVEPVRTHETVRIAGLAITLVPVVHPPTAAVGVHVRDPATGGELAISGDTSYAIAESSRDALRSADLALVEGIVHADYCEGHPAGGAHHDAEGTPRTFGTKHMTLAGARALAADLDADRHRIVHCSHFVPPELAFADDVAVDGETFAL